MITVCDFPNVVQQVKFAQISVQMLFADAMINAVLKNAYPPAFFSHNTKFKW